MINTIVKTITTEKEVLKLVSNIKKTKYCSFDFETNAKHPADPAFFATICAFSFQPGFAQILPLQHINSPLKDKWLPLFKIINDEVLMNEDIIKVAHNIKFEDQCLKHYGFGMRGRQFDTMLAKYALDEEKPHGLKDISSYIFPETEGYDNEVSILANRVGWENVPIEKLSKYCGIDSDITLRLMIYFEMLLIKNNLYALFRNMLMMLSRVLAESEFEGMEVDEPYLDKLIIEYTEKIKENDRKLRLNNSLRIYEKAKRKDKIEGLINGTKAEIRELVKKGAKPHVIANKEKKISAYIAGKFETKKDRKILEPFNFSSPAQLVDYFFIHKHGLRLPIVKYTEDKFGNKTENPSTDEEVMLVLKRKDKTGFIDNLLESRSLNKLFSTYMVGVKEQIICGKVHPTYFIHGTVTGRFSCKNPNMQNIPRDTTSSVIKKMFRAPEGYKIVQIDYSQAELRVLAEISGEETMAEWFRTGRDIHLAYACKKYHKDYETIVKIYEDEEHPEYKDWKRKRKQAKTINFGIAYEQSAGLLADSLSEPGALVTKAQAEIFLREWFQTFPKIKRYIENQHKKVKRDGFVTSLFGRKRRLPDIYSSERGKMLAAERMSSNAPIQGSASDFAAYSSILIREQKLLGNLPSYIPQKFTVHDSLGYCVKDKDIHKFIKTIKPICQNPETLKWFNFEMKLVKMDVDAEVGQTWGDLKRYKKEIDYAREK